MTNLRHSLGVAGAAAVALFAAACGGSSGSQPPAALTVACWGSDCAARSPTEYAGSGVGIWQYRNATGAPVSVEFTISGVHVGQRPLVLFTNGGVSTTALPQAPDIPAPTPAGALRAATAPDDADLRREGRNRTEWELTERNRELGLSLPYRSLAAAVAATPPEPPVAPPRDPEIDGTVTHAWDDTSLDNVTWHTAIALAKCDLPERRKAIFWVDEKAWTGSKGEVDRLASFRNSFCGTASVPGGYAKVTDLRGSPWGADARKWPVLIQDDPAGPLSVHVVFLDLRGRMGGYFHGVNAERTSTDNPRSNEALAIFIDSMGDPNDGPAPFKASSVSTMLHEATHLVNYYQRTIIVGSPYDTWLEEMSAMMTEDIVPETVTSPAEYLVVDAFILPYLKNGGGISLINWGYLDPKSYAVGGSFGAFLNRRYGLSVYKDMVKCPSSGSRTYHACLDELIRGLGGTGFDDEFARMGATVFALLDGTGAPPTFGFPARLDGGYFLRRIDLSTLVFEARAGLTLQESGFQGTSHARRLDRIAPGSTTYSRTGDKAVTVPAGTSLTVVVR